MEGYCVRCKSRKEMKSPVKTTLKNGRPVMRGTCACGTKMVRFIKKDSN